MNESTRRSTICVVPPRCNYICIVKTIPAGLVNFASVAAVLVATISHLEETLAPSLTLDS